MQINLQSLSAFSLSLICLSLNAQTVSPKPLPPFDLGVLPLGEASLFSLPIDDSGLGESIVVEIKSDCPCLEVLSAPEALTAGEDILEFAFTPNGPGPAQINLNILTLDVDNGTQTTLTLPVSMIGFAKADMASRESVGTEPKKVLPSEAYARLGAYNVIDVRGPSAFEKARIPGSFEYSLDALLAKRNLHQERLLLVGEGALNKRERRLLGELAAKAPQLELLSGGMVSWLRQGLPVEGKWPSSVDVSTISLQRWLEAGGAGSDWSVLDLSNKVAPDERFFGHEVIRSQGNSSEAIREATIQAMETAMRRPDGNAVLVIGDARELVYPLAEVAARSDGPIQVFYLEQGVVAYQKWKERTLPGASNAIQTISLTTSDQLPAPGSPFVLQGSGGHSGCSTCPKK